MSNCVRCGVQMPAFSVGEVSDLCRDCRQQIATESQLHPEDQARPTPQIGRVRILPKVTVALIAVNSLVFVAMVLSGISPIVPKSPDLVKWGADWGPLTLGTQPWRSLTSTYIHIGIIHIFLNMWCLWNLGMLAEVLFGRVAFLAVYTLTGIAGSVVSLWWKPVIVSAGASGAVFGIAGALITALYFGKLPHSREAIRPTLKSVVMFAVYNLFIGAASGFVNNAAHIGGLLMGLALGAVLGRLLMHEPERRKSAEMTLFVAAALVLLVAGLYVRRSHANVVTFYKADEAIVHHHPEQGIAMLEEALKVHPNNLEAQFRLARAYVAQRDYTKAETLLASLRVTHPDDQSVKYVLGVLYVDTHRFQQARDIFLPMARDYPKRDDVWVLLGMSQAGLGDNQTAIVSFQRAIDIDHDNADAYREMGILQFRSQQVNGAIQNLQKATELDPQSEKAYRALGAAYLAAGQREQAEQAVQKADQIKSSGTSSDD